MAAWIIRIALTSRSIYFFLTIICLFSILGCAHLKFPTYYDPTTYKNLTDLKPEVSSLYDSFSSDPINSSELSAIRLKLSQIYEYEKGKGPRNGETTQQIKLIQDIFERGVSDRVKNGQWNETNLNNRKKNITDAFDTAIQTERLKNKNE